MTTVIMYKDLHLSRDPQKGSWCKILLSTSHLLHVEGASFCCCLGVGDVFFETGSQYVAQAGLQLKILPPQPPECWDYTCASPCPALERGSMKYFFAVVIF
jgi:hypothetical protein